jgi:hypothetical protein
MFNISCFFSIALSQELKSSIYTDLLKETSSVCQIPSISP